VVECAGFEVLNIKKANYGGVLFCVAKVAERNFFQKKSGNSKFLEWKDSVERLNELIENFIKHGMSEGNSFGCYVPLRSIPYLSTLGITNEVRFFDDDPGIHKKYFDGFPIPVENMEDLRENPVSHLLILSTAFGEMLRDRINEKIPMHQMEIKCLNDFKLE
jgi:hypothetical protein